jgi:predicted nucleotidyltransferase
LDLLEKHTILNVSAEKIASVCDCTEGLENAFKKAATISQPLEETLTSPRYTASRIRRIALQNLLNIDESLIRQSLCNPLYLRVLAVDKEKLDVLSALSSSSFPTIIRAHDDKQLVDTAKSCYGIDLYAQQIYSLLHPNPVNKQIFI